MRSPRTPFPLCRKAPRPEPFRPEGSLTQRSRKAPPVHVNEHEAARFVCGRAGNRLLFLYIHALTRTPTRFARGWTTPGGNGDTPGSQLGHNGNMSVIREADVEEGRRNFLSWRDMAKEIRQGLTDPDDVAARMAIDPKVPRRQAAMAVRYSLHMLEIKAPGPGVEVRVAPWGAIKILDGPASDPHNLTPPDVIELDPEVWLRLATGITSWQEEREVGHITAVGERDDLHELLPLV